MISHLHIENYALISHLDLDLQSGFSVITGETGAGKSILLGAIALILGSRADTKSIKTGCNRCIVEATFDLSSMDMDRFFADNDLDFDGTECIIRRELTSTGKSRAFINDTPVQLALLKTLGDNLIDIHSQHQNLLLSEADFQLQLLDSIASDTALLKSYQSEYNTWRQLQTDYQKARQTARQSQDDEEYLRFQLQQLVEAHLSEGEQSELEHEQELLEHSEDIKQSLYTSLEALQSRGDTTDAISLVRSSIQSLQHISDLLPEAPQLIQRLQSCRIELQDIADEIDTQAESIEYNPERLAYVTERLATLYTLQKKHHVDSVDALLALQSEFQQRLDLIESSDETLARLQQQCEAQFAKVGQLAAALHTQRIAAADTLQHKITTILQTLGMPNVQFAIDLQTGEPGPTGYDTATYLFSANKNIPPQPISRIASGGEIARLMLALKSILADNTSLPTVIFDEIDTGVSGSIAEQMGHLMASMAQGQRQVISITHLPQIAALGTHHMKVYKDDTADTTQTHIITLTPADRIEEIAHMLSGAEVTDSARANAKALLG